MAKSNSSDAISIFDNLVAPAETPVPKDKPVKKDPKPEKRIVEKPEKSSEKGPVKKETGNKRVMNMISDIEKMFEESQETPKYTERVGIVLPKDTMEAFEKACKKNKKTKSEVLRMLIDIYIKNMS